jgi:hypothetical protein
MQEFGKIKTLLEEGVLTEVEFNTKKAELIKQRKERKAAAEGDVGGQGAAGKSPQGGGGGQGVERTFSMSFHEQDQCGALCAWTCVHSRVRWIQPHTSGAAAMTCPPSAQSQVAVVGSRVMVPKRFGPSDLLRFSKAAQCNGQFGIVSEIIDKDGEERLCVVLAGSGRHLSVKRANAEMVKARPSASGSNRARNRESGEVRGGDAGGYRRDDKGRKDGGRDDHGRHRDSYGDSRGSEKTPDLKRSIDINKQIMGARGASELCTLIEARVAEFNHVNWHAWDPGANDAHCTDMGGMPSMQNMQHRYPGEGERERERERERDRDLESRRVRGGDADGYRRDNQGQKVNGPSRLNVDINKQITVCQDSRDLCALIDAQKWRNASA